MTSRFLIDDEGDLWRIGSSDLSLRLGIDVSSEAMQEALIRNIGYVRIVESQLSTVVGFRPKTVSMIAFAAVLSRLYRSRPERTVLEVAGTNELSVYPNLKAAMGRMQELIHASQGIVTEPYSRRLIAMDESASLLLPWLAKWKEARHSFKYESWRDALHGDAHSRYVLVRSDTEAGGYRIERAGDGLRIPDAKCAGNLEGRLLHCIPDEAYGRWINESYALTEQSLTPRLEAIEAMIYWPRSGRVPRRYLRLILPFRDRRGNTLLLGIHNPLQLNLSLQRLAAG